MSLRNGRFWFTQALVLGTVAAIYLTDVGRIDSTDPDSAKLFTAMHVVAVAFAAAPVLYAAFTFGLEGAILTTLWVVVLVGPLLLLRGSHDLDRLVEPTILATVLIIGTVLALRVEVEREARQRAEALSVRLSLLHEVLQALAQHRALPDLLQDLVDTIRSGMAVDYAAVEYRPSDGAELRLESGRPSVAQLLTERPRPHRWGTGTEPEVDMHEVLLVAEQASFGTLRVARQGRLLTQEERQVLTIVGLEVSAAFEMRTLEEQRRQALQLYARQVTNAQEEERTRIARDLHDGPVQLLAGLVRAADLIEKERYSDTAAFSAAIERLQGMSEEALTELRRVTRDLRPMTLHRLGLQAALRSLAADAADRSGIAVDLHVEADLGTLPEEVELCVYRIVQEALTNIEKHAQASVVRAEIRHEAGELLVAVHDNGRGLNPSSNPSDLARGGRFGLLGMRERAALVGGTLQVVSPSSGAGQGGPGTSVLLRIPLAD